MGILTCRQNGIYGSGMDDQALKARSIYASAKLFRYRESKLRCAPVTATPAFMLSKEHEESDKASASLTVYPQNLSFQCLVCCFQFGLTAPNRSSPKSAINERAEKNRRLCRSGRNRYRDIICQSRFSGDRRKPPSSKGTGIAPACPARSPAKAIIFHAVAGTGDKGHCFNVLKT